MLYILCEKYDYRKPYALKLCGKYFVDYPQQNKEILQKSIKTNNDKYGCDRPSQNKKIIEAILQFVKNNIEPYKTANKPNIKSQIKTFLDNQLNTTQNTNSKK